MLSKTVHLRPLKCSSIIRVKTPEKEGRIHQRNAIIEPNFEYKPINKTAYDPSIYKFQRERLSKPADSRQHKLPQSSYHSPRAESAAPEILPCHAPDYFVYKKKKFNEQAQIINNVPLSDVVSNDQYKTLRSTSQGFNLTTAAERGEEADRRNVYRRNFYISKANAEINQDFKFQPLIRNAQTTSEDTPYWFQGTAKFYTKESSDLTKKMRNTLNDIPKADIFGKPDVEYPKTEYPFVAKPPSKGQRYELNKMVIIDKINQSKSARGAPQVSLRWEEHPQKQSYDRARLTWKIGEGKPVIKKLEAKAKFDPMVAYKKIGEYDDAQRIKQEKAVDIKIGHPNNAYTYGPKKQRDDGFLANRKEINGQAYQTSTFFV